MLRDSDGPVRRSRLDEAWPAPAQRERCLASLLDDGLVAQVAGDPVQAQAVEDLADAVAAIAAAG